MTTMVKEKAMNWLDAVKKYDNTAIAISHENKYDYVDVVDVDGVCIINNEAYAILSSDYFTLDKIFMRRGIPHIIYGNKNISVSDRTITDLFIKIDAQLLVEDCSRPPLKEAHRPKIFLDLLKVLKEDGSL